MVGWWGIIHRQPPPSKYSVQQLFSTFLGLRALLLFLSRHCDTQFRIRTLQHPLILRKKSLVGTNLTTLGCTIRSTLGQLLVKGGHQDRSGMILEESYFEFIPKTGRS